MGNPGEPFWFVGLPVLGTSVRDMYAMCKAGPGSAPPPASTFASRAPGAGLPTTPVEILYDSLSNTLIMCLNTSADSPDACHEAAAKLAVAVLRSDMLQAWARVLQAEHERLASSADALTDEQRSAAYWRVYWPAYLLRALGMAGLQPGVSAPTWHTLQGALLGALYDSALLEHLCRLRMALQERDAKEAQQGAAGVAGTGAGQAKQRSVMTRGKAERRQRGASASAAAAASPHSFERYHEPDMRPDVSTHCLDTITGEAVMNWISVFCRFAVSFKALLTHVRFGDQFRTLAPDARQAAQLCAILTGPCLQLYLGWRTASPLSALAARPLYGTPASLALPGAACAWGAGTARRLMGGARLAAAVWRRLHATSAPYDAPPHPQHAAAGAAAAPYGTQPPPPRRLPYKLHERVDVLLDALDACAATERAGACRQWTPSTWDEAVGCCMQLLPRLRAAAAAGRLRRLWLLLLAALWEYRTEARAEDARPFDVLAVEGGRLLAADLRGRAREARQEAKASDAGGRGAAAAAEGPEVDTGGLRGRDAGAAGAAGVGAGGGASASGGDGQGSAPRNEGGGPGAGTSAADTSPPGPSSSLDAALAAGLLPRLLALLQPPGTQRIGLAAQARVIDLLLRRPGVWPALLAHGPVRQVAALIGALAALPKNAQEQDPSGHMLITVEVAALMEQTAAALGRLEEAEEEALASSTSAAAADAGADAAGGGPGVAAGEGGSGGASSSASSGAGMAWAFCRRLQLNRAASGSAEAVPEDPLRGGPSWELIERAGGCPPPGSAAAAQLRRLAVLALSRCWAANAMVATESAKLYLMRELGRDRVAFHAAHVGYLHWALTAAREYAAWMLLPAAAGEGGEGTTPAGNSGGTSASPHRRDEARFSWSAVVAVQVHALAPYLGSFPGTDLPALDWIQALVVLLPSAVLSYARRCRARDQNRPMGHLMRLAARHGRTALAAALERLGELAGRDREEVDGSLEAWRVAGEVRLCLPDGVLPARGRWRPLPTPEGAEAFAAAAPGAGQG